MEAKSFSPRDFLRARRPEQFSDSIRVETPALDRSILEYHLDTLTNRNEATDFENFARRLAEREICPNLLPQTGPTGGGDSKVDSETYPVADDLSLGWYVGIGREAASERWAFAFSAKKEWRSKVRSDIAKVAATERGYRKAFFISNQYIPDRVRAEVEDELRNEYGLDVRVLDRTWILDKVFRHGHESLAIETLKLTTSIRKEVQKGPLDTQRERELDELEKRIQDALHQQHYGPQLVDDCIRAAILARSLERPSTEIDARFLRAERVSAKYGTLHQRVECAYQRAWTAFWWHEDYDLFTKLYSAVEALAKGSRNAYDLELLTNLWFLLHSAFHRSELDEEAANYKERTATLIAELKRLSDEQSRPSTSLQAETLLLLVLLALRITSQEPLDSVLHELQTVVRRCEGLVGYPLEPLVEILMELGNFLNDVPAYEELFETIIEVVGSRKEEVSAARMLLKRGAQQLAANRPYDAIRSLCRALHRLYKHESRHDLVRALYLCGCAYERVGLLWAARGTLLTAASVATDEYWRYGDVTLPQAACYRRLKWLELQLGRLPHALSWHEADTLVRNALAAQGYNWEHLSGGELEFDAVLGLLLLKTDFWELKHLSTLPDVLDGLGLHNSAVALRYALGYEDEVPKEYLGVEDEHEGGALYDFFLRWRNQPAAEDLAATPLLYNKSKITFNSSVLGCRITVESENTSPCVELAESTLAALESLLSTGPVERVVAREPILTIAIRRSDFAEKPFRFEMRDHEGRPHLEITCSTFDPHNLSLEEQAQVKDKLFNLLANVIARVVMFENPEQTMEKMFKEELALERSINFTGSFVVLSNVLGHNPKTSISNWFDSQAREYTLRRSEPWDAADRCTDPESSALRRGLTFGEGDPPEDLVDRGRTKHKQIATVSLIRETLWNKAGWSGTAFLTAPGYPPILALIFRDAEAAKQIFSNWRNELGACDANERLRVSIVRGIDRNNRHAYRVVIGSKPEVELSRKDIRYAILICRLNTMEPTSDVNLMRFLSSYEAFGEYFLAPAVMRDRSSPPEFFLDQRLMKRELYVREAWKIGRNDVDAVAIKEEDEPIIPSGQENPPVLELLRWKREL